MKKGFTLAEVLITLLIIGVVAALTIPSVISNYQQMEFKTGLKKAVSVLNEAIQVNIAQDGETPYENEDLFSYLKRHMNVVGNNILNDGRGAYYHGNNGFYTVDGIRFEFVNTSQNSEASVSNNIILHETGLNYKESRRTFYWDKSFGPAMGYYDINAFVPKSCGSYGLINNPNNTINPPCIVTVDVNGDRKPNPASELQYEYFANGALNNTFSEPYTYPAPSDKKVNDVFNILITEEKAIPFGVVAQRAMYSK